MIKSWVKFLTTGILLIQVNGCQGNEELESTTKRTKGEKVSPEYDCNFTSDDPKDPSVCQTNKYYKLQKINSTLARSLYEALEDSMVSDALKAHKFVLSMGSITCRHSLNTTEYKNCSFTTAPSRSAVVNKDNITVGKNLKSFVIKNTQHYSSTKEYSSSETFKADGKNTSAAYEHIEISPPNSYSEHFYLSIDTNPTLSKIIATALKNKCREYITEVQGETVHVVGARDLFLTRYSNGNVEAHVRKCWKWIKKGN